MKRKKLVVAAALLALVIGDTHAQELPNPKPGKPHEVFKHDAGTWDSEVKMYFGGPQAPPTKFKGVEKTQLVSGDLYLKTEYTSKMGDRVFEGHGLVGYNSRTEKYEGTWVDNFGSIPTRMHDGTYDAKTKTFTIYNEVLTDDGQTHKQKQVTTYLGEGKKKFEIYLLLGKGQDFKFMEMTQTRRK